MVVMVDMPSHLPTLRFTANTHWSLALWAATTFQWHPSSDAPPIMGLVFANVEAGRSIFRGWVESCGNQDLDEEIRIAIIEGDIPAPGSVPRPPGLVEHPGYRVHISPDPDNVMARATAMGIVADPKTFGHQINHMTPTPGMVWCTAEDESSPTENLSGVPLLPRFKQEYAKHQQYLLAPVTPHEDGQLYVDVELGIEKSIIHFRDAADIIEDDDIDAAVLRVSRAGEGE